MSVKIIYSKRVRIKKKYYSSSLPDLEQGSVLQYKSGYIEICPAVWTIMACYPVMLEVFMVDKNAMWSLDFQGFWSKLPCAENYSPF